jgi:signal transduction histidine kinase
MRRGGLRRRVMLASALLGLCLSLLFGATMVWVAEAYEHILVEEIIRGEAENYSQRVREHGESTLPRTRYLSGWLSRPDGSGEVPARYAELGPGIHELENERREGLHIGVFDTEQGRFFFAIDLSDIERLERVLATALVLVLGLGTALATWFGRSTAGTIIAPVTRLAAAVDALPVQPQATAFAADVARDELGRLAQAIDRYQQRLVEADASERAFFADASHELRTPVAVVRGAVELLAEDATDAGMQRRVRRLERGVGELTDLIDLLFGLVRRREAGPPQGDAEAILRAAADDFPAVRTVVEIEAAPPLPEREAALLARGILRRLVAPETPGSLRLRADAQALDFVFEREDARASGGGDVAPARSDRGLGLTLAGRLAARLGWRIQESGTHVRVWLSPDG